MKVVAFNGSPKKEGNTYHAIKLVADELEKEGIEIEIIHIGNKNIRGCMGCNKCRENMDEKCIFDDDAVNEMIQKLKEADGVILGTPVHYTDMSGTMKSFLDRLFYVNGANGNFLKHKVGVSVVAVRRSGGMTALNQLNSYLNYSEMIVPTSYYWNVIHGRTPGEVLKDEEGVCTLKTLGRNMAWAMKLVENGRDSVKKPEKIEKESMSFIR
ncbi:Multimeric flavodoxin WrbA [Dethiosulfatibacter aminovorans DSM 17477]|uniref:Multimeric flavodoxin WrbA n=1 Tax=Dethiosulfatibacter aminovorans DSM 17477 TaxID=1121476 RepID=A0A1M6GDS0_9FIRM|nr:flavodoxin family protein [Dethiosulfatibacter aminovorans]SHJ08086.1 Multimeric flavodoxin WrbA [Dethiosulfatibacter aminovorans DSM 17477]